VYSFSPSQFEQREVILMEVGGARERNDGDGGKGKSASAAREREREYV